MTTPGAELPFDFVEFLCDERHIERDAALALLAESVRDLSRALFGALPYLEAAPCLASAGNGLEL